MKRSLFLTLMVLFAVPLSWLVAWSRVDAPYVIRPNQIRPLDLKRAAETNSVTSVPPKLVTKAIESITDRKLGCHPKGNIVFIKTHKTGGTTMRSIFNRYGIANNLSFLQHRTNPAGHITSDLNKVKVSSLLPPLGVHTGDYKRYKGYNISNTHSRMLVKKLREFMNPHSDIITILRHPVEQWLSAFQYFHGEDLVRGLHQSEKDRVQVFLKDPLRYTRRNVFVWNNQLHDLGMGRAHFRDYDYVAKRIKLFSQLFSLVLITEYFDESLILLKDLLCWTFEDIIYVKMRAQPERLETSPEVRANILRWNAADFMLYTHFNKTLWKKIRDYGPNFEGDLRHFRELLKAKHDECVGSEKVITVSGHHKNIIYSVGNHTEFCELLVDRSLSEIIHTRQNSPPIPPKIYEKVKGQCNTSQSNIVFVKTHKTGGTTLTSIMNRFGYTRNLSFVQTSVPGGGHFNYRSPTLSRMQEFLPPIGVAEGDFLNYNRYNISSVHIRYSRSLMEVLMGNTVTYYITILREPVSQFVSAFRYFELAKALLPINTTSNNFEDSVLKVLNLSQNVFLVSPFAWNNQIFDLGMRKVRILNDSHVRSHIKKIDRELDLVLIMEYFDESLILLKKLLCWEYKDILYIKKRAQPSPPDDLSPSTMDRLRKHNHADGMLYEYFNRTLWRRIAEYGPSFEADLRTFRGLSHQTLDDCIKTTVVRSVNRGQKNIDYVLSDNATALCNDIISTDRIRNKIRKRQGG